ncbi:hypothetical protein BaRGS_00029126 [Batillaria attramentaria]|uniref:Receptor ligand binding region domain-containing protein n=1 Tax=Batillaria attramentaria TaxID=370345 RepID=A0ABD0JX09_9CAEN
MLWRTASGVRVPGDVGSMNMRTFPWGGANARGTVPWRLVGVAVVLCHLLLTCQALPDKLRVGALFEPEYEGQKRAFEWAVESVNLKADILGHTLVLDDDDAVQPHDSFGAQRKGKSCLFV